MLTSVPFVVNACKVIGNRLKETLWVQRRGTPHMPLLGPRPRVVADIAVIIRKALLCTVNKVKYTLQVSNSNHASGQQDLVCRCRTCNCTSLPLSLLAYKLQITSNLHVF